MRKYQVLLAVMVLMSFPVFAQAPEAPAGDAAPSAGAVPPPPGTSDTAPPPPPPPAAAPEPEGDVITLKSGSVMKGVQVVRKTAAEYVVKVSDDVMLNIPRKQVTDIKYDDINPGLGGMAKPASAPGAGGEVLPAEKLKPEVYSKITAPIPGGPLKYENQDFVEILGDLSKKVGVTVTVGDRVKAMPPEQRTWTLEVAADTTLMGALESLVKQFPGAELAYAFDKIQLVVKQPPAPPVSSEAAPAPAAPPAPASGEPAPMPPAPAPAPQQPAPAPQQPAPAPQQPAPAPQQPAPAPQQ